MTGLGTSSTRMECPGDTIRPDGDIPVPGNYTPGRTSIQLAVWRPNDGTWHIRNDDGNETVQQWGQSGDIPVPGNYTRPNSGDASISFVALKDLAIYRPNTGTWWIRSSLDGSVHTQQLGQLRDKPVQDAQYYLH